MKVLLFSKNWITGKGSYCSFICRKYIEKNGPPVTPVCFLLSLADLEASFKFRNFPFICFIWDFGWPHFVHSVLKFRPSRWLLKGFHLFIVLAACYFGELSLLETFLLLHLSFPQVELYILPNNSGEELTWLWVSIFMSIFIAHFSHVSVVVYEKSIYCM